MQGSAEIVERRSPIADRIRERVRKAGRRFHANDNISAHNIVRDRRHRDVTLLHYAERAALDPFSMTGSAALALVEELVSTAAIVNRDLG